MKPIKLLFIASLLFTGVANAQITKGNWMVGGSGSFKSYTSKRFDNGNNTFKYNFTEISPNIGYFFIDKLVVGTKINLTFTKSLDVLDKSYNIGPFIRYYFLKPENQINVFAQANFGYGEYINDDNSKFPTRNYGFKVGPVIYLNSSVALEMGLEYNKSNENSTLDSNYFQISLGFQIHLEKN